jgi:hypothetical protein
VIISVLSVWLGMFVQYRFRQVPMLRELTNSYAAKVANYENRRAGISNKPVIPVAALLPGHTFTLPNKVQACVTAPPMPSGDKLDVLCTPVPTGGPFTVKFDPDDVITLEGYE